MKSLTRVIVAFVALAVSPCYSDSRTLPDLPCFELKRLRAAPLVFGELKPDPSVPGGWSGMEVHFGVDNGGKLTAAIREVGGASRATRPVERVTYYPRGDTLSFTYVTYGSTTFRRTFRPGCNSLVGFSEYIRPGEPGGGIVVADTLPRVQAK